MSGESALPIAGRRCLWVVCARCGQDIRNKARAQAMMALGQVGFIRLDAALRNWPLYAGLSGWLSRYGRLIAFAAAGAACMAASAALAPPGMQGLCPQSRTPRAGNATAGHCRLIGVEFWAWARVIGPALAPLMVLPIPWTWGFNRPVSSALPRLAIAAMVVLRWRLPNDEAANTARAVQAAPNSMRVGAPSDPHRA